MASTREPGGPLHLAVSRRGTEFTYKTRLSSAYGGWKTITKKTKRVLTREEMLDMRIKNKSDRHCM